MCQSRLRSLKEMRPSLKLKEGCILFWLDSDRQKWRETATRSLKAFAIPPSVTETVIDFSHESRGVRYKKVSKDFFAHLHLHQ